MPTGGTTDTTTEWGTFFTIVNPGTIGSCSQANVYDRMVCIIKLPYTGNRNSSNGLYYVQGSTGYYWSSTPTGTTNAFTPTFNGGSSNMSAINGRAAGMELRCLRN